MLAALELESHETMPVAAISGEIDASNAAELATQLKASMPNSAIGLVLDLSQTTYIDSSGVHLIFDVADALRRRQQILQLVVPPDTFVADLLKAVNVSVAAKASESRAEALEALRHPDF
jgi:anti-anti-sigma factor